ncbi:MAG: hypothetical protein WKG07_03765 [Hymenobacter sp.]
MAARQEYDYARDAPTLRKLVAGLAYEYGGAESRWSSSTAVKFFGYQSSGFGRQDSGIYLETEQAGSGWGPTSCCAGSPRRPGSSRPATSTPPGCPMSTSCLATACWCGPTPRCKPKPATTPTWKCATPAPAGRPSVSGFARNARRPHLPAAILARNPQPEPAAGPRPGRRSGRALRPGAGAQPSPERDVPGHPQPHAAGGKRHGRRSLLQRPAAQPALPVRQRRGAAQPGRPRRGGPPPERLVPGQLRPIILSVLGHRMGFAATKATIPSQLVQNAGLSYALAGERLTLSAELHNLANTAAYDNYNVQRPGRSGARQAAGVSAQKRWR